MALVLANENVPADVVAALKSGASETCRVPDRVWINISGLSCLT